MIYLFDVGFINFRLLDILDILIVAYFLYLIYKLLKGTIAFNIIIGVLILYIIWWIVNILKMQLLILLLGKFVAFGFLMLIIIFQPEIRRFLIYLGNSTLKGRFKFLNKFGSKFKLLEIDEVVGGEIKKAILDMASVKTGALIILTSFNDPIVDDGNGVVLDAKISSELIESIFNKESPLHDGAMVIVGNRIHSVGAILPVSTKKNIPSKYGTRHRSAIGFSEISNGIAIIVSEESGNISYALEGVLHTGLGGKELQDLILERHKIK